jgi:membrane-bound lytic murein transglycosylase D
MFRTVTRILSRRKTQTAAVATLAAISSVGLLPRDAFVATAAVTKPAVETKPVSPKPATASTRPRTVVERLTSSTRATNGLPNLEHPRVDTWIKRFTTTQRGSFNTYLRRMPRYETMISKKLADRGMPQGLIYLAMIESGFNPRAKSPVSASGLWQFMSATGREYGLTVNRRVDERNNPVRSTDAALRYLDRLHDRFGSWYLAAAAYNTGQGRVAKVLKQVTGKTRGTDADYYRIAHRLPQETRDYVPKMIAAARIGTNPAQYGFSGD